MKERVMSSLSTRPPAYWRPVPAETMASADIALARAEWQETVFDARPNRVALLQLQPSWPLRKLRISVLRNHAVEPVITALRPFLAYAGLAADITLSGYDDSLSAPPQLDADAHIVWLDPSRYAAADQRSAGGALSARLRELRTVLQGPLLLVDASQSLAGASLLNNALHDAASWMPDVFVFPYALLTAPLANAGVETRPSAMGTHVSGGAALLTAQQLGLRWIPALIRPRLKAVIVDLDETIVGGVLSEDGVAGVITSGPYTALREQLLRLHEQGVLLALVTKNDARDVESLFAERADLAQLRGALVALEAGWHDKSASVVRVAERLRIGMDTVLVFDDNPAEVAAMAAALHGPWFVVARTPSISARALELHPGLLSLRDDALAGARSADLVAGEQRDAETRSAAEPLQYLHTLRMEAQLSVGTAGDRARLSELSRKTNQFNTALARLSETDVERYMSSSDRRVVSIRLRDRLSDSGLIGAVFARRDDDTVIVDEIAISCRALGRSIERALLGAALSRIASELGGARVVIPFTPGPRNAPAGAWLSTVAAAPDGGTRYVYADGVDGPSDGQHSPVAVAWEC